MTGNRTPRRFFFRDMARETLTWCEEMCGIQHVKLSDVAGYPPEVFAKMMPRVRPGTEVIVVSGRVCARLPGAKDTLTLFPVDDESSLDVFNRFNGETSLGRIAKELAETRGWTEEEGLAKARSLFLHLLELMVCVPGDDAAGIVPPRQGVS